MRLAKTLMAGAAATVMMAGAASAEGLGGGYLGTHAGLSFSQLGVATVDSWNWGLQTGYNFVGGNFLAGVEVRAGLIYVNGIAGGPPPGGWDGLYHDLSVHLGAVMNESMAVYGLAGIGGCFLGPGCIGPYVNFGAGAEVAVGGGVGIVGQVYGTTTGPFGGGFMGTTVTLGINMR